MAEKLSWSELRRAIATRAGVNEKTAGVFLNALTSQLLEGLRTDKAVKINGLGTFKLQAVAPRLALRTARIDCVRNDCLLVHQCQPAPEPESGTAHHQGLDLLQRSPADRVQQSDRRIQPDGRPRKKHCRRGL